MVVIQNSKDTLAILNPKLSPKVIEGLKMGLGICEMRCLRTGISPGKYLTKVS